MNRRVKRHIEPVMDKITADGAFGIGLWNRAIEHGIPKAQDGESVLDREWDNLIILDALRWDTATEVLQQDVPSRISLGSCSPEYVARTYSSRSATDCTYISANPHTSEGVFKDLTGSQPSDVFDTIHHLYTTDEYWNDEVGVATPDNIIQATEQFEKNSKRTIIHAMQPHHPFLSQEKTHKVSRTLGGGTRPWDRAEAGYLSKETIVNAYRTNVEIALELAQELDNMLNGKTVVTSDHGNLLGEHGRYGHPPNRSLEPLRRVPWIETEEIL